MITDKEIRKEIRLIKDNDKSICKICQVTKHRGYLCKKHQIRTERLEAQLKGREEKKEEILNKIVTKRDSYGTYSDFYKAFNEVYELIKENK